jgi:hypothetical protein
VLLRLSLLLLISMVCTLFLSMAPLEQHRSWQLGATDPQLAQGFFRGETDATGRGYRWTTGNSRLLLPALGTGPHILRLDLTAPHPDRQNVPVQVRGHAQFTVTLRATTQPRRYHLLLPTTWPTLDLTEIQLESPTFSEHASEQARQLGVLVYEAHWRAVERLPWLVPLQVISIALLVAAFAQGVQRSGMRGWLQALLLIMLVVLLLAMRHSDPIFWYRWNALAMTALALVVVLGATFLLRHGPQLGIVRLDWPRWARHHWLAFGGYVALTLLCFQDLLPVFSSHVPGHPGDNFEYLWKVQWFSDALLNRRTTPLNVPSIYYPTGTDLTISEMATAHTLLGVPLTWLAGPVVTYNTVVLVSFVLSGFFTYLLVVRIGGSRMAGWVAGVAFAFYLGRWYHLIDGHFGMIGSQWLPLALYAWEGVLTRRRAWDAQLLGLVLVLLVWTAWMYAVTFGIMFALYALVRIGRRGWSTLLQHWRLLVIAGLIVVPLILPIAQPYLEARLNSDIRQHALGELLLNSPTPADYLRLSPFHPWWGVPTAQTYRAPIGEFLVAPALSVLCIAGIGLWVGRRTSLLPALLTMLIVSFVLSLGPLLQLDSRQFITLPAGWIYAENLPLLGDLRTWGRFSFYVMVSLAVLVGLGLSAVPRRWQHWAVAAAALLILSESVVELPLSTTAPRPVDRWLAQQSTPGAFAQIPRGVGGVSHWRSWLTRRPTVQGTGKYAPALRREERDTLYDFPALAAIQLAQRWNIAFFVVTDQHMDRFAPGWRTELDQQTLVREVYRDGTITVYQVQRRLPYQRSE